MQCLTAQPVVGRPCERAHPITTRPAVARLSEVAIIGCSGLALLHREDRLPEQRTVLERLSRDIDEFLISLDRLACPGIPPVLDLAEAESRDTTARSAYLLRLSKRADVRRRAPTAVPPDSCGESVMLLSRSALLALRWRGRSLTVTVAVLRQRAAALGARRRCSRPFATSRHCTALFRLAPTLCGSRGLCSRCRGTPRLIAGCVPFGLSGGFGVFRSGLLFRVTLRMTLCQLAPHIFHLPGGEFSHRGGANQPSLAKTVPTCGVRKPGRAHAAALYS